MNTLYLIDLENVQSAGLEGVELLSEDDYVLVFYSNKADNLKIDLVKKIKDSPAEVDYIKADNGTPNALDFQLLTYLFCHLHAADQFWIVSKDTGYDASIKMCRRLDVKNVRRAPAIKNALHFGIRAERSAALKAAKAEAGAARDAEENELSASVQGTEENEFSASVRAVPENETDKDTALPFETIKETEQENPAAATEESKNPAAAENTDAVLSPGEAEDDAASAEKEKVDSLEAGENPYDALPYGKDDAAGVLLCKSTELPGMPVPGESPEIPAGETDAAEAETADAAGSLEAPARETTGTAGRTEASGLKTADAAVTAAASDGETTGAAAMAEEPEVKTADAAVTAEPPAVKTADAAVRAEEPEVKTADATVTAEASGVETADAAAKAEAPADEAANETGVSEIAGNKPSRGRNSVRAAVKEPDPERLEKLRAFLKEECAVDADAHELSILSEGLDRCENKNQFYHFFRRRMGAAHGSAFYKSIRSQLVPLQKLGEEQ